MSNDSGLSGALQNEDEVGRVIRAHLYIENLINNFLEISTPHPEHLKAIQLDYFGKVQLSLCLGLPERFKKSLNCIGKIRNDFAHKLNFQIDKNLVNNFFDTFSETQKGEIIQTSSLKSLSWVEQGKTWKMIKPSDRLMVMTLALYYGLRMALIELEREGKIKGWMKRNEKLEQ